MLFRDIWTDCFKEGADHCNKHKNKKKKPETPPYLGDKQKIPMKSQYKGSSTKRLGITP